MRHLRPCLAVLAIAAIVTACSPGASGSDGDSSQAAGESQPAASPGGGGGGGGGGGANGSITYEITGDYEASGELPFLAAGLSQWIEAAGGWVASFTNPDGTGAYVQLNTQTADGTTGQGFTFGDGTVILVAASGDTGMECTFNLTKNDASGLAGDLHCNSAIAADAATGAQKHVQVTAQWDAHP